MKPVTNYKTKIAEACQDFGGNDNMKIVYVPNDVHKKLKIVSSFIADKSVTISSLLGSIVRMHFKEHFGEIKDLIDEAFLPATNNEPFS